MNVQIVDRNSRSSEAPRWLRTVNALLTAWNSFALSIGVLLVVSWFFPAFHDLGGAAGLLVISLAFLSAVWFALVTTRWQRNRMRFGSLRSHLVLLMFLLLMLTMTFPQIFIFTQF